ncbi:MAG: general secretion pathway protein GspK, partial [Gammaproteobacteria bacterium]|nr:general secretion pathway protein GspK [Gammaproteobacteria bacterium]
ACINVNSLVNTDGSPNAITEARLTQLFTKKGITNNLTQAIIDWIDSDLTNTTPNGAEDGYYMNLEKPYRTAQSPLFSIYELRLIKGFEDNDDYQLVTQLITGTNDKNSGRFSGPALCAFNTSNPTPININTASVEVLESIQDLTDKQIDDILQQRTDDALTKVPAVFTTVDNLATESSYYLLKTRVLIGNASRVMYSIIYWDGKKTSTISRTLRTL